jgi:hypothetical protein
MSLLRVIGYRRRKYNGHGFSVQIKSEVREGVSIVYKRHEVSLVLKGERTRRKWEGIQVSIPMDVERAQASQVVLDLKTAFGEMDYEYDIARGLETLARSRQIGPSRAEKSR